MIRHSESRPVDETDRRIIEALWEDARQSFQAIADHLGLSEGTIRTRVKRLQADRVVRMTAVRNIESLQDQVLAYLWIQCDRKRLREIAHALAAEPRVGYVASLLGRADLLAIASQESPSALLDFVDNVVTTLPGVLDLRIEPVLRRVKSDVGWGLLTPSEDAEATAT